MLSRVADSLYWMSRYVERAENVTRLLTVNFNMLLDAPAIDESVGWRPIIELTGDAGLFRECFDTYATRNVIEFMLWHPANPNAVTTCITLARENARSVREQISSEMWENINKLYFLSRAVDKAAVLRGPHEFFAQVRDGSHTFQGVTHATVIHGEAYEFIQLGKHVERAGTTLRIVDAKYATVDTLPAGSPEASLQLIALLKSCSAFEAFRKTHASQLQAWRVAEYLLLSDSFPRAVRFCLNSCLNAVNTIAGQAGAPAGPKPGAGANLAQRLLGKLCADLEFMDIRDVLGPDMHEFLAELIEKVHAANDAVTRSFFNTQVIVPAPRSAQQAQQQQQQ